MNSSSNNQMWGKDQFESTIDGKESTDKQLREGWENMELSVDWVCHLEKVGIVFAPKSSCNCPINQMERPKQGKHVIKGTERGSWPLIFLCVCVCVSTSVCVICFLHLEIGNYLRFAEKANLSSTMVLRLQYTAGVTFKKTLFVHACVFVHGGKCEGSLPCVYVYRRLFEFSVIVLMAQLTFVLPLWGSSEEVWCHTVLCDTTTFITDAIMHSVAIWWVGLCWLW